MKWVFAMLALVAFCFCVTPPTTVDAIGEVEFIRGDIDGDGDIDYYDLLWIANYYLFGKPFPAPCLKDCDDAADVNDDGYVSTTDLVYLNAYLYQSGPPPAAPWPDCGEDPTEDTFPFNGCLWHPYCGNYTYYECED